MPFDLSARQLIVRLIGWLILASFVGYVVGYVWPTIALVSISLLLWHYLHLNKLVTWLWNSKALSPPMAEGSWGRIYDGLYHLIRKHRNKQKALNERIRRFRDGAEALPDAALVLSNDLTILWGNKKAQKLIGIQWPGDVGQRIDNLIRFPEFASYLEEGNFESPCNVPSPLNAQIQLELRMMAYGTDQVLFLARDISKVHRLEEMRRDFVANVSHELKTPLTVVRGYVEMIQVAQNDFSPQWLKAFETIEGQVSRMDRLVEQLLVLSRVEVNSDVENNKVVNMPELIRQLIDDSQWLNIDKNHQITTDIAPDIDLFGSDTELKSACSNLLSNAIAYTSENGHIQVSWQQSGDHAKFTVKDNGPGIKPIDVARLTERFYRVDKSRSRDTGGSGLGLAIVKHVVSHHQGRLDIKSKWGQGSEFSIYFPAEQISTEKK